MIPYAGPSPGRRMSRSRPGRALAVALVGGGLLLAGCGPASRGRQPSRLAARWSDEASGGLLDVEALAALRPPAAWRFGDPAERERWSLHGLAPTDADGEVWRLKAQERPARLSRHAELPAAAVTAVVLRAAGSVAGRARLFWSGKGNFARERSVAARARPGAAEWRFELSGQQHWVGSIRSLRFDLPVAAGGSIALESVEFLPADEPLGPLLGRPWSVTLGSETRPALVVPPAAPAERRWALPAAATTLRLAYGLLPGNPCTVRGELTASVEGTSASQAPLRRDLPAPPDESWQEVVADVSDLAGRKVTLRLRSELVAPCPEATPALVVSLPELLSTPADQEPARPNLVLISVDTLRADRLGIYGYSVRPTSPRLDAWARRGVVFESAVATAPWTLPSHVSMLTGTGALAHGVNYRLPAPESLPFLAEILRARGYSTAAWTGGSWLAPRYGFAQGFDVYRAWTAPDDWDGELAAHVEAASEWLASAAVEPFFLFFHTFETHAPYVPREPFYDRWARAAGVRGAPIRIYDRLLPPLAEEGFALRKQLAAGRDGEAVFGASPDELLQVGVAYDSGVAYADRQLGRLLDALEARGLAERTVVVLTSDHGESLGEEGLVSHGHLHDSNLRVPLVLALPEGGARGTRIPTQISLADLVPTVLDLLGLPVPGGLDGRSLSPLLTGQPAATPRLAVAYAGSSNLGLALRADDRRKYLLNDTPWPPLAGREAVYELGEGGVERLVTSAPEADLGAFRAAARRLLERGAGLHVRIWNGEPTPLTGTLRGPCVHPVAVKSVAGRTDAVVWVRRQEASFELAAGELVELRFDSPGSPCLEVRGGLGGAAPFALTVDPALADEALLGLAAGRWGELPPHGSPRTGVRAWRVGPSDLPAADPAAADPDLLEQLEALGYVE